MEVDEDGRAPEARWPWGWHVPFGTGYPNSWMVYDGKPYITLLKWMIWGTPILGDNQYSSAQLFFIDHQLSNSNISIAILGYTAIIPYFQRH
jgi:hypothetical protein